MRPEIFIEAELQGANNLQGKNTIIVFRQLCGYEQRGHKSKKQI